MNRPYLIEFKLLFSYLSVSQSVYSNRLKLQVPSLVEMANSELILSKMYNLESASISFEIGLNPSCGDYKIQVKLTIFSDCVNSILLQEDEFLRFVQYILLLKNKEEATCKEDKDFNQFEINEYIVVYSPEVGQLLFYCKTNFMLCPPIFQVQLNYMQSFIERFNPAMNYYIMFLLKYRDYASLVHNRIVKFYIDWLKNEENLSKFSVDFLEKNIVTLESSSLPKIYPVVCDYSCLDYHICYLIDSEIRLNAVFTIYLQIILSDNED